MRSLTCVMINDGSIFVVDIDEQKKVGILKRVIKEENKQTVLCDAKDLTLFVAKKGGQWLRSNDPDLTKLENGNVPDGIKDIMAKEENKMDPSYSVRSAVYGFPDDVSAEDGEIHVLVKVPVEPMTTTAPFWLVTGSVTNPLSIRGVRGRLYRLADTELGYYDPAIAPSADERRAFWYENDALYFHVLFKKKSYALRFQSRLNEDCTTIRIPSVVSRVPSPRREQRIFRHDDDAQELESLHDSMSIASDATLVGPGTPLFEYQRIETFPRHCWGESVHLMSRSHCLQHETYAQYDDDESNRLVLSLGMHGAYDKLSFAFPVINIEVLTVSDRPVLDNRYKVELHVSAFSAEYVYLLGRLKDESTRTSDPLVMKTFVHVEDPVVFSTCMAWKHTKVAQQQRDFFSNS